MFFFFCKPSKTETHCSVCVIITVLIRRIARTNIYNIVYTFRKIVLKPHGVIRGVRCVTAHECVCVCVFMRVRAQVLLLLQRAVLTLPSRWLGCAALSLHNYPS
jgi:hypothetical protein